MRTQASDSAAGVQHGGVVPIAERLADFRQAHLGKVLGERHRHLARACEIAAAFLRMHVAHLDLEIFGDGFLDTLDADLPAVEVEDIAQGFLRQVERQLAVAEPRESEHLLESALELAHVGADVLGDEKRDVFGQRDRVRLSLFQHDCDAHLQLRRLGGHGKAPSEARDQALFHARDFLRVGVAGDDDLFARLHQRVERVEKLLLGAPLVGKKLDVVDQQ